MCQVGHTLILHYFITIFCLVVPPESRRKTPSCGPRAQRLYMVTLAENAGYEVMKHKLMNPFTHCVTKVRNTAAKQLDSRQVIAYIKIQNPDHAITEARNA